MAEQALRAGIAEILPVVSAADKPFEESSGDWTGLLELAQMNLMQLGISQEIIESMEPPQRPAYILQKKVEMLKSFSATTS
jgi:tRNA nucleotidyltransferase (CCA-adding enzyme)